jgi:hypothetical protein
MVDVTKAIVNAVTKNEKATDAVMVKTSKNFFFLFVTDGGIK